MVNRIKTLVIGSGYLANEIADFFSDKGKVLLLKDVDVFTLSKENFPKFNLVVLAFGPNSEGINKLNWIGYSIYRELLLSRLAANLDGSLVINFSSIHASSMQRSYYGKYHHSSEKNIVKLFLSNGKVRCLSIRLPHIYGGQKRFRQDKGVLNYILNCLESETKVNILNPKGSVIPMHIFTLNSLIYQLYYSEISGLLSPRIKGMTVSEIHRFLLQK